MMLTDPFDDVNVLYHIITWTMMVIDGPRSQYRRWEACCYREALYLFKQNQMKPLN